MENEKINTEIIKNISKKIKKTVYKVSNMCYI